MKLVNPEVRVKNTTKLYKFIKFTRVDDGKIKTVITFPSRFLVSSIKKPLKLLKILVFHFDPRS